MKISLLLFTYLLHGFNCMESNTSLLEYLNVQTKIVGEKLIRHAREDDFSNVKFNYINTIKLFGDYQNGEIFTLFNVIYLLKNFELYELTEYNYAKVYSFSKDKTIKFIRTAETEQVGFLLIVTNSNVGNIFGINKSTKDIFKIQNMMHLNISDAIFFQNQNQLYLVVANQEHSNLTLITIYNFNKSYFDVIETITISNSVNKLHTFKNNESDIIVVLRDFQSSVLYEFEKKQIKKISKIQIDKPQEILNYSIFEKQFVLIFSENQNVTVYYWNGFSLVLSKQFTSKFDLNGEKSIIYSNNNPYLIIADKINFLVFSLNEFSFVTSKNFEKNWSNIWTYTVINQTHLIALGSSIENTTEIEFVSVSITKKKTHEQIIEDDTLNICFLNFEKSIYVLRNKITKRENSTRVLRQVEHEELSTTQSLINKWESLQEKYLSLNESAKNQKTRVVNKPAVVDLPIGAHKVTAKNLRFNKLNIRKWEPKNWLLYNTTQKISGTVEIQTLKTFFFKTNKSLLNDLLLDNSNQTLNGSIKINNVKTNNLETRSINNISLFHLYYKNQPVNIQGKKTFQKLETNELITDNINKINVLNLTNRTKSSNSFNSNFMIKNLIVENINNVNFEKFKKNVFRLGLDQTVEGNLIFQTLQADQMLFDSLSNKSEVLTASTNQTIKSTINIPKIFASDVKTNTINGIDFKNSVATFDNNTISGPVSIKHLIIKNSLEVLGNVSKEFLILNDSHIVGTNETDFLQRYNGNVTIKGNLILKNFNLGKSAKLYVSGEKFRSEIDEFWTKSTQQTIPVHFEAQNGMSTSHLFTNTINSKNIKSYLLNSTKLDKPTKYYFDCVIVKGNVFLSSEKQHTPNLKKIENESVKIEGTFRIRGRQKYENLLKIENLEANHLQSKDSQTFTNKSEGPKKIANLFIRGDLVARNISVQNINNINLETFGRNVILIDKPQNISKVKFANITVQNLIVTDSLNGNKMSDLESKLEKISKLDRIDTVYANEKVIFKNINNLETINEKRIDTLLKNTFSENTISGNISFRNKLKVKDLVVLNVNNINLQNLTQRIFYRSWNQTITETFKFKKLTSKSLITDNINNYHLKNIIDVSNTQPQTMYSPSIKFKSPTKIENLNAQLACDLHASMQNLHNPPSQHWNSVVIKGNVSFLDKDSFISRIFEKAILSNKKEQTVSGEVHFANHISANNITTEKTINNISLTEIIDDALLNNQFENQIITASKIFRELEAEDVFVMKNANLSQINGISVQEVDSKIISKNSILDKPIKGQKVFFGGLQARNFKSDFVSKIQPKNLVSYENAQVIPHAIFESVSVSNNFNISLINGMPLDVLLTERLLINSSIQTLTGNYFFRNIQFKNEIETDQINDIEMENIVFDEGIQIIESTKKFRSNLKISGNITTEYINGLKISEAYEQAALKNETTNFTGIVQITSPSSINGYIQTHYVNNIPVEYMIEASEKYYLQIEARQIKDIRDKIAKSIYTNLNKTKMPNELLYLEKAIDLQISFSNAVSADIVETKDVVLIHIESEEDGSICDLPETCRCPMQQTLQISSEFSFNVFLNKEKQRIYSYYNDDIIINFITHSISSSSLCRRNQTKVMNEVSTLTWNVPPKGNKTGGFYLHRIFFNGFIQRVEFFNIYETTYAVVGISYDPVLDTNNVNTLVFKFNEDKTAIQEIQKIPTFGLKTISLFPTAQGVILIMGCDYLNHTSTHIFRFNYEKQQFELLREVPIFGSLFVEGIVLEMDSLIILANKRSTLLVLRYHPEYDNFYLYQNFQLDYPITSMAVFYSNDFGLSDAYLSVVTSNKKYFIYSFWFIEGWKLEFSGQLDDAKILTPFKLKNKTYLFAPSSSSSFLLSVVEHD